MCIFVWMVKPVVCLVQVFMVVVQWWTQSAVTTINTVVLITRYVTLTTEVVSHQLQASNLKWQSKDLHRSTQMVNLDSVSYTHLTLPTILLV